MFVQACAIAAGSLPLTMMVRRSGHEDDALLLGLYIGTAAGFAAWLTLPLVEWTPSVDTLFGVAAWRL